VAGISSGSAPWNKNMVVDCLLITLSLLQALEGYFPSPEDHTTLWTLTSHPAFCSTPLALLPMENIKYGLRKWRDYLNVECINERNVKTV
jgi:hypothetical protein